MNIYDKYGIQCTCTTSYSSCFHRKDEIQVSIQDVNSYHNHPPPPHPTTLPPIRPSKIHFSCHHGNSSNPNNLGKALEVIDLYKEIDIVEVDFVYMCKQFVSSHDYDVKSVIENSSPIHEWIYEIIIKRRRILWIDIKENWSLLFQCLSCHKVGSNEHIASDTFDAFRFFRELENMRNFYSSFYFSDDENPLNPPILTSIDISDYILVGCQDLAMNKLIYDIVYGKCSSYYQEPPRPPRKRRINTEVPQLIQPNPTHQLNPNPQSNPYMTLNHWMLILDKPKTTYYAKLYLPEWLYPLINKLTKDELMRCDFSRYKWIGLDASVFDFNIHEMSQFIINQSSIQRGSHIIIYTFPIDVDPFSMEGYHIVFQYDYTVKSSSSTY